jgi:hypothetical protein
MKRFSIIAAWVAVAGMCLPQVSVLGQGPAVVGDIRLAKNDTFVGQVVNAKGTPQENVEVQIMSEGKRLASAKTTSEGYFAFSGVRSGVYTVGTDQGQALYRVWNKDIAPPAAKPGALLVSDSEVVRGQTNFGFGGFLGSPLVVAGIVAAAVAIPVAVHNANLDSKSSS